MTVRSRAMKNESLKLLLSPSGSFIYPPHFHEQPRISLTKSTSPLLRLDLVKLITFR